MELDKLEKIKRITLISLFSDDDLMDTFVLKGGSALNMIYSINNRASIDLDLSMESDFDDIDEARNKISKSLISSFEEENYHIFDIKLTPRPMTINENVKDFWGGYCLEFKVIENEKYETVKDNIDSIRRNAMVVGDNQKKVFKVDISKYEYCKSKSQIDLDGYVIYAYTPLMVVYEKLRAICQQMEMYRKIVPTNRRSRARDFFDIYTILENWKSPIDICKKEDTEILKEIFKIKRVPLNFLGSLETDREFHRQTFSQVINSVGASVNLKSFDFYFDYVIKKVDTLKFLWEK